MHRPQLSLARVLLIYTLGLLAGVQGALYLYDTYDDGVSEPLSGWITRGFVALGLGVVAWSFRTSRA